MRPTAESQLLYLSIRVTKKEFIDYKGITIINFTQSFIQNLSFSINYIHKQNYSISLMWTAT